MWEKLKERLAEAGKAWLQYECASLAAGVAFYAGLSLFPLMLALIAGVGYFFSFVERGRDAKEQIIATLSQQVSPQMGEALGHILGKVGSGALVTGPVAGVMLLFTASVVFFQIDRGFMRIWDVRQRKTPKSLAAALRRMAVARLRSLTMLFGTGLVVILVFLAGVTMRLVNGVLREWFPATASLSWVGSSLIGIAVNTLVFFLLYRFLSKERPRTQLCLVASLCAAALWECGSALMGLFSFGSNFSVYGVIGSFLVVQIWIYYNAMVLFAGAVLVRVGMRPLDSLPPVVSKSEASVEGL
ncbi:ribonuclease BN [Haloferula helveola]|uniref:Ribonuclease BN n=1 Tax=Haloferula helveola TaxID=490095 RepID=A0ABN6H183_9BACT|nr:ribonuclease BN [Haloferula helveola]